MLSNLTAFGQIQIEQLIKLRNYLRTVMGEASETGSQNEVNNAVAVNKGTETGTETEAGPTPSPSTLFFVSSRGDFEEKTIVWKIEDFSEVLALSNAELLEKGVTFEAGTCALQDGTKTSAIWKYYFKHTKKDEEDWIGGYLSLLNDPSKVKCATASYSVSLSSGGSPSPIASFTSTRKEFATSGWGCEKLMGKAAILEKTKPTDTLDVSLIVKVFSGQGFTPVLQAVPSSPSAAELKEQVNSDLGKMLESGDGADVEIRVPKEAGGEVDENSYTKQVHKTTLMGRSTVFSKMFAKESDMVEAKTGKVVIKDLSPKGLDVFLRFLYTGEVLDEWVKVPEEILNCAEKYNLEKLKNYCGNNLMAAVTPKNSWKMYYFAKLHNLPEAITTAIEDFIHKYTKAVLAEGSGGQR